MERYKTAVLVVHGIGSQRPLATLRGLARALWTENPDIPADRKRIWFTYDRAAKRGDLDLPTLVTEAVDGHGLFEFHEVYWAHTMAETRFAAVPLWLFELIRKGPGMLRADLRIAWYVVAGL